MSYAIESKKRKFHRALESISKPATPANAPKPATATHATAKDRLPANLSIKKVRLSSNDYSDLPSVRNSMSNISGAAVRSTSASSNKRPTFAPWDRDIFLERLETFRRVDRWDSKPTPINEVQWAKRGWICTDSVRVSCVSGCGGSVVVKLPDEIDELDGYDAEKVQERKEVRERLVEEYAKMLKDGHEEKCPWRNKACDDTIQHLPLNSLGRALSGLHGRYFNLLKMKDKLPTVDKIETPKSLDLDATARILPEEWFKDSDPVANGSNEETGADAGSSQDTPESTSAPSTDTLQLVNQTALALALFGWDSVADGAAGIVSCRACFRRLGLWMYKPKENGEVTVYSSLDVSNEHMEYCPWIDRVAQSGTGRPNEKADTLRSGWEVVADAVKVKNRRRLRSGASLENIRSEASTPVPETVPDDINDDGDEETKKKADREWWARIRRIRQSLKTKSPHKSVAQK
ncbi:hypothetical protein N7532_008683 [Penicillium argentinense]|uniref:Uncharacterized protein n=1 Tax=Penicillium argentinense TaxID=1131581 RepID=A0A9W9K1U2_9EURO|nr:uncharacterized protein N7532_008683 [Penicillium argentinense]KAJ5089999.1 hypothetical protein N7532_008683 [Penicillium argentinense]